MTATPEIQNRIVGIIGRKGTGKSTRLAERLQTEKRVFVWDPMAEHDWSPNEISSPADLESFFRWNRKQQMWAANYVPGNELPDELEEICPTLYGRGGMTLAIEEVPLICTASHLEPAFGKLIRTGRHKQIDILWTAQRASEVSRTLTSLTDEFVLFSQTEPRDLDAISARCGPQAADKVAQLGRHDFVVWDVVGRQLLNAWPMPQSNTAA
jgi:hypothetical protein